MPNRDLLVLSKNAAMTPDQMQQQISQITSLLHLVENMAVYCNASEVIDINRYKIIQKAYLIEQIIRDNRKPFVFVMNKN